MREKTVNLPESPKPVLVCGWKKTFLDTFPKVKNYGTNREMIIMEK